MLISNATITIPVVCTALISLIFIYIVLKWWVRSPYLKLLFYYLFYFSHLFSSRTLLLLARSPLAWFLYFFYFRTSFVDLFPYSYNYSYPVIYILSISYLYLLYLLSISYLYLIYILSISFQTLLVARYSQSSALSS